LTGNSRQQKKEKIAEFTRAAHSQPDNEVGDNANTMDARARTGPELPRRPHASSSPPPPLTGVLPVLPGHRRTSTGGRSLQISFAADIRPTHNNDDPAGRDPPRQQRQQQQQQQSGELGERDRR
jgi:hypothetical protein